MEWIEAKSILSPYKYETQWFGHHYTMNLYKGCNHGCIYCDSRSDCYHIEDFDRVRGKDQAIQLLEKELKSKKNKGVVGIGAMSDCYNPMEKTYLQTQKALQLLNQYRFGVSLATKSDLVTRDIPLFKQIMEHSPVLVLMTITANDDGLSKRIEPHVVPSSKRFEALRQLAEAGIPTGILMMPLLPFITAHEDNITGIIERGKAAGVKCIYPAMGVTLRGNQRTYFLEQLHNREMAKRYEAAFGLDYHCPAPNAKSLYAHFATTCDTLGITYKMAEIISLYQGPYEKEQLAFPIPPS